MYQYLYQWMQEHGLTDFAWLAAVSLYLVATVLLSLLLRAVLLGILSAILRRLKKRSSTQWPESLLSNQIPQRLANLAIPVVIALTAGQDDPYNLISRTVGITGLIALMLLISAVISAANEIYETYEVAKIRPVKGLLQVVQVVLRILCSVAGVAILLGENPVLIVGGLGAAAAVVSFIFKDPILNFVAGIQLTANHMLQIGDWIEMPKYALDGDVLEISMTTVKVQNFDQTITSVPAQALVNDSFINWRGMQEAGGRRMKRSIVINAASVRHCDEALLERFSHIKLLEDYLAQKSTQITAETPEESMPLNRRQLTNLGTFRAYMQAYLRENPAVHPDMTVMVRQLAATAEGIPLEVYAFAATTQWEAYEAIQADIFDHFYAAAATFDLEVYQSPSGADLRLLRGEVKS